MSYKLSIVKNKMMKRIINILILLCCIASLSSCGNSTEERSRVLKIYNWADYIDEDVLAEFPDWYKQQTGEDLRIIYQVFDINEIMLTKIERGHEDFDVVCPSEYIIERMLRKDLLLPIDRNFGHTPDYIPNVSPYIRHELNKTSQPERQTEDYAVPYMWGTAGILFNKKFITAEEAGTWDILWDSKNRGKILMKDSYRDAYGTAIIYAHARELADSTVTVEQLMNDNSPQAIALAEQRLKEMKPNIAGWEADFGKEMMTKNKAWINFTWSGDAVWAIEEADAVGVELDYTGEYHTVREFATLAFKEAGIDLHWEGEGVNEKGIDTATGKVLVEVDPKYFRPAEVEQLLGDPTKAKTLLGWNPRKTSFEELVGIMVKHDMKFVKKLHLKASC